MSVKRAVMKGFWRVINPLARPLAGVVPWWVLLETTGNKTGRARRTPLATGPMVGGQMLLIAVHGRHSGWVRNLEANPAVRVRIRRRWVAARATVDALRADDLRRFNAYARTGPALSGIDPLLVRLHLAGGDAGYLAGNDPA